MQDIDKELEKLRGMLKQYEQAYMKCMGAIEYLEKKKSEGGKWRKGVRSDFIKRRDSLQKEAEKRAKIQLDKLVKKKKNLKIRNRINNAKKFYRKCFKRCL